MADTLVLANLSIDSAGVVSGIKQSNAAMASGDAALGRFGAATSAMGATADAVVGKLFNFRQAFSAMARSLGVVGLITGLAFALKGLAEDLISSTRWFKDAKEAVTDWWLSITKGESAVAALSRKMKDIGNIAGLRTLTDLFTETSALGDELRSKLALVAADENSTVEEMISVRETYMKKIQENIDLMFKLGAAQADIISRGGTFKAGIFLPQATPEAPKPAWDPKTYEDAANRIFESAQRIAEGNRNAAAAITAFWQAEDTATGKGELMLQSFIDQADKLGELVKGLRGVPIDMRKFWEAEDKAAQSTNDLDASLEKTFGSEAIGELVHNVEISGQSMNRFSAQLDSLGVSVEMQAQAIGGFFAGLSRDISQGEFTWKKLMADMLMSINYILIAIGTAATSRALAGDHSQWATAAYAFAGAVIVAGLAAALGGHGANERGRTTGGGGRNRAATGQPQNALAGAGNNPTVTVIVQGSMFGTNEDELGRSIARWVNTAQNDGSV